MTFLDIRAARLSRELQTIIAMSLERSGLSARQASISVVGHDGLIRDIRAGRMPAFHRVDALLSYFGVSMRIGCGERNLSLRDLSTVHEQTFENCSDAERIELALIAVLTTGSADAVKGLRQVAMVADRQADDLERLATQLLSDNERDPLMACEVIQISPASRQLASGTSPTVPEAFSNTPAGEPLTAFEPVGGHAAREPILPRASSSQRAALWSRFCAWSDRMNRSWAGACIGWVAIMTLTYFLTLFLGVL